MIEHLFFRFVTAAFIFIFFYFSKEIAKVYHNYRVDYNWFDIACIFGIITGSCVVATVISHNTDDKNIYIDFLTVMFPSHIGMVVGLYQLRTMSPEKRARLQKKNRGKASDYMSEGGYH